MRADYIVMAATFVAIIAIAFVNGDTQYDKGFEAGKLYVRNAMLQQTDSILGCSRLGYIPDTISVKQELKNGGSYEIKGKKN